MRLRKLLENKLFLVFFLFIIFYVLFLLIFKQSYALWWDSAAYIGIGKFLFSNGAMGIFEPMKTILLPLILGFFWKLGFDAFSLVYLGVFIIFLTSILSLFFLYKLSREFFNKEVSILATIILYFNTLFFIFIFRIYTEMFSICFILGAIFFMVRFSKTKNHFALFLSALFSVLTFTNKYPYLLLVGILNLFLIYEAIKTRKVLSFFLFNIFFLILLFPFLIYNFILGGDILYLIKISQIYFKENLGILYSLKSFPGIPKLLFKNTDFLYFKSILYLFNILLPFMFIGIYRLFRSKNNKKIFLLFLPALLLFCFFELFYLKQERYLLPIFPLLALFSAYGISMLKNKKTAIIIIVIYVLASVSGSIIFFSSYDERGYADFFINPQINFSCEKAATSDPRSIMYQGNKKILFPYEVFEESWNGTYILKNNPDCVFYFSCYNHRERIEEKLSELGYNTAFYRNNTRCTYAIFKKGEKK